jgi:prophage antirepressor-like protein
MSGAVALQSFGFGDQLVRVADIGGGAWFIANDVCGALEISNSRHAVSRLEDDERDDVVTNDAIGRSQSTTVVSESGVYALIFTSRKPIAKQFRKWVTSEVLPTLRRTGHYEMPEEQTELETVAPDPIDSVERVRTALQMVREARITFGNKAAQRAWLVSGLPDVTDQRAPLAKLAAQPKWQGVSDWFDERTEPQYGNRISATALYLDYSKYCGDGNNQAESIQVFGRALNGMGVDRVISDGTKYLNIRIKD